MRRKQHLHLRQKTKNTVHRNDSTCVAGSYGRIGSRKQVLFICSAGRFPHRLGKKPECRVSQKRLWKSFAQQRYILAIYLPRFVWSEFFHFRSWINTRLLSNLSGYEQNQTFSFLQKTIHRKFQLEINYRPGCLRLLIRIPGTAGRIFRCLRPARHKYVYVWIPERNGIPELKILGLSKTKNFGLSGKSLQNSWIGRRAVEEQSDHRWYVK